MAELRKFETGATRDTEEGKLDYEGFLSPLALRAVADYMERCRRLKDGVRRATDNWQLGIPPDAYIKSAYRHLHDWWLFHRGFQGRETLRDALCGLAFNVLGRLHELEKQRLLEPQEPLEAK